MTQEVKISKVIPQKITGMTETVQAVIIKSDEDNAKATELLANIRKLKKFIKDEMDKTIKPLREVIRNTQAKYKPYLEQIDDAERTVKEKMTQYYLEVQKKEEEKKRKLAERVQRGTMKVETAVKKIEEMPKAETTVKTDAGQASIRTVKEVSYADISMLKDEEIIKLARGGYLTWNKAQARKDALAGKEVPGVIINEKKTVAVKV